MERQYDTLTDNIAKIGENMTLRRMETIEAERVVTYVPGSATRIWDKLSFSCDKWRQHRVCPPVAMHVAAANHRH